MKKTLIIVLIAFLLVVNVKASAFAIIGMHGLQLINPEAAKAVSTVICVANPIACAEGKVVGYVAGEAVQALAEVSPEAAKAVVMANQIKGYVDEGAAIVNELQLNENGEVVGGSIKIGEEQSIGNLMNSQLDKDSIKIADSEYSVKEGTATVMVGENGYVKVKDKETGLGYSYENIKKGGLVKLDNNGKVTEADFAAKEGGGTYAFGTDVVKVPSNARVIYKNGEVKVIAKEGDVIETSQIIEQGKNTESRRISVLKDGDVNVKGNRVYGKNFVVDNRLGVASGSVLLEGEGILLEGKTKATALDIGFDIRTGNDNVMYYKKGIVPCQKTCYPSYISFDDNKLTLSSRTVDGFDVDFKEGNLYGIGKTHTYSLRDDYAEVNFVREGKDVVHNIKTGDGKVYLTDAEQVFKFENGKTGALVEKGVVKIGDSQSKATINYGDTLIKSFSDGSTEFCGSFSSATGFVILDFVTGSASDLMRCVATAQGKKDVVIDIQVDKGYHGYMQKFVVNNVKIDKSNFVLREDGMYEHQLDSVTEKDAQGYNIVVDRRLVVNPDTGSLKVEGVVIGSEDVINYDITTGPKSLSGDDLKVFRDKLGLPEEIVKTTITGCPEGTAPVIGGCRLDTLKTCPLGYTQIEGTNVCSR
ncbi:MAG: hypothetical protein AB1571_02255 [Nanoarchaeota archaeon]